MKDPYIAQGSVADHSDKDAAIESMGDAGLCEDGRECGGGFQESASLVHCVVGEESIEDGCSWVIIKRQRVWGDDEGDLKICNKPARVPLE